MELIVFHLVYVLITQLQIVVCKELMVYVVGKQIPISVLNLIHVNNLYPNSHLNVLHLIPIVLVMVKVV